MSNVVLLSPGDEFEKYTVVRELGHGGMGAVYLVHHPILDTDFALKVLFPEVAERDPQFVQRFIREARLAGRIRHQNLIAVHDAGRNEKSGMYYLIMDFVAGGSVRDKLKKNHYVDMLEAISIVRQVASALEAAQKHNMVHRDIKPDNIMFDAQGVVKLADLGIAKASDDRDTSLTIEASVFGTPAYMSPEQARDSSKVDTRADIYSLGVVFYEMLTGRRPFTGNTSIEILTQVIDDTAAPDVRTYSENIPEDVARLAADMLVKDRDKRIASPTKLIKRLDALDLSAYQAGVDTSPELTMPTMVAPVSRPDVTMPTMATPTQQTAPPPPPDVTMPTMASPTMQSAPASAPDVTMPTMAAPTVVPKAAPTPAPQPEVTMPMAEPTPAPKPSPAPQPEVTMPMAEPTPAPKPSQAEVTMAASSTPALGTKASAPKQQNALPKNKKNLILVAAAAAVLLCLVGVLLLRGGKKEPPVQQTSAPSVQTETIPTQTVQPQQEKSQPVASSKQEPAPETKQSAASSKQETVPEKVEPKQTARPEPPSPEPDPMFGEPPKQVLPQLKTIGTIQEGTLVVFGADNNNTTSLTKALEESGAFKSVAFQEASKDLKAWTDQINDIQAQSPAFILVAITGEKNNLQFKRMLAGVAKIITANTGAFLVSSGESVYDEIKDACNPTGIYFRKWASNKELVNYVQELRKELGW